MELEHLIRDERADFRDMVRGLAPDEWDRPTLCDAWSVRDVVGHVLANDEIGMFAYMRGLVAAGLSPRRYAERVRASWAQRPHEEIVAFAADLTAPQRMARSMQNWAPLVLLTETFVHQQDVRRAIGWGREVDEERMVALLHAMVATGAGVQARRKAAGLRVRATDADFAQGDGPEVAGPSEVLVMTLAGRIVAPGELHGDGARVLLERASGAAERVGVSHRGDHAERRSPVASLRERIVRHAPQPVLFHTDDDTAERAPVTV